MKICRIEDRCNKCMLCVQDCVSGVWRELDGIPTVVAPGACNLCSHCLAVCPKDAIIHDGLDGQQIRRVDRKQLDPKAYYETITGRRSVRHYKDKPVSQEIIESVLELARYSPTASNSQNVQYIVIQNKPLLRQVSEDIFGFSKRVFSWSQSRIGKILFGIFKNTYFISTLNRYIGTMGYYIKQTDDGRDFILHHAPVLILIHAPKGSGFSCDNCNIAATNIINYAYTLNLGTCFIGFLTMALKYSKALRHKLGIPRGRQVFASLVMGFPDYRHSFTSSRKKPDVKWI
jgi:nitroreductase/NAD-dependent dihydropyrimidine dehydrogenase PreA subunit